LQLPPLLAIFVFLLIGYRRRADYVFIFLFAIKNYLSFGSHPPLIRIQELFEGFFNIGSYLWQNLKVIKSS